jgi:hypothetical protein
MRPGQNKRMRGRNNNNRKGPNPLTRSYESNGPDVKIRGTPHHIAEKYLQLARDAHSSGDPVMAESYLQHAEHYFRLIAAAQQAQAQAQVGYQRPPGEPEPEDEDDDDVGGPMDRFASPVERVQPQPPQQAYQPQPYQQPSPQPYQPAAQPYGERPPQPQDRQPGEGRPERGERPERQDRGPRQFDRNANRERWRDRQDRPPREARNDQPRPEPPRERMAEDAEAPGLPAFITAPPRLAPATEPAPEAVAPPAADLAPESPEMNGESGGFHLRPRRRRRRPVGEVEGLAPAQDAPVGE